MNIMLEWLTGLKWMCLLLIALVGCGNTLIPATNTPSLTITATSRPTSTPLPTVTASPPAATVPIDIEATAVYHLEMGQELQRQREHEQAIVEFDKAIELDPTDAEKYSARGVSYHFLASLRRVENGHALAIADQTKAIELEPYLNGWYHYLRGWSYIQIEQNEKAVADFAEANRLGIGVDRTAPYHLKTGQALHSQTYWGVAIVEYDRAIELDPTNAESYNARGTSYYHLAYVGENGYELAIADQTKAIELEPNTNAWHYYSRAWSYYMTDQNEKACVDLAEADRLGHQSANGRLKKFGCGREVRPSPTPTISVPSIQNSNNILPEP